MSAVNVYPSPPRSVFMFGSFDMDAPDPGSAVALGEAMLGFRKTDPTLTVVSHNHRHASGSIGEFMFGVHAEQPPPTPTVANEEIIGLWSVEQT